MKKKHDQLAEEVRKLREVMTLILGVLLVYDPVSFGEIGVESLFSLVALAMLLGGLGILARVAIKLFLAGLSWLFDTNKDEARIQEEIGSALAAEDKS